MAIVFPKDPLSECSPGPASWLEWELGFNPSAMERFYMSLLSSRRGRHPSREDWLDLHQAFVTNTQHPADWVNARCN